MSFLKNNIRSRKVIFLDFFCHSKYNTNMDKRFFITLNNFVDSQKDNFVPQVESKLVLDGEEHNHFARVLRGRVGDIVECFFDGSDIFVCQVDEILKNQTLMHVLSINKCLSNPTLDVTLFQGLPKLDKLELITQKCCEIGVNSIIPFTSSYTIAKDSSGKISRLDKIIISSCKQCQRSKLLKISNAIKFDEMCSRLKNYDLVIFANEKERSERLATLLLSSKATKIAYIVGSEGGFSDDEIEKLSKISKSITLGERILRTETAAIAIASNIFCILEK